MNVFVIAMLLGLSSPSDPALCRADTASSDTKSAFLSYCCIKPNGQQCCSKQLDSDGKPDGCGC